MEKDKKIGEKIKKNNKKLANEIGNKVNQYIGAGFGLVAGLAWNDAIKSLIVFIFPNEGSGSLWAKFAYAFLMTLVVVFFSLYVSRILKKDEGEKK